MALLDSIKGMFKISAEENKKTKDKITAFVKQATKRDHLNGFIIAYGKHAAKKETLTTTGTKYYNYAVAFNRASSEMIILPIDPKLASCGWPVFINGEVLKSAREKWGICYEFCLHDGDIIMMEVPAQNYKIGKMLGAMELPIEQQEEAAAFKTFFKDRFPG